MRTYEPDEQARRNADIVRRLIDALGARDAESVEALLTEDVAYHVPGQKPMSARRSGRSHSWRAVRIYHLVEDHISEVFGHDRRSTRPGRVPERLAVHRGNGYHPIRLDRLEEDGRAAFIRPAARKTSPAGGTANHAVRFHAQARSHHRADPRPDPPG